MLSHIHDAEPAFADLLQNLVMPDDGAGAFGQRSFADDGLHFSSRLDLEKAARGFMRADQLFDALTQFDVVPAGALEKCGPVRGRLDFNGLIENPLDTFVGVHNEVG